MVVVRHNPTTGTNASLEYHRHLVKGLAYTGSSSTLHRLLLVFPVRQALELRQASTLESMMYLLVALIALKQSRQAMQVC